MLLERERELAELNAAIAVAKGGSGCAVAIEGDAGLGKTRLLREVRAAGEEAGLNVLAGRATELERAFPFALLHQLFEAELLGLPAGEREGLLDGAGAARGALGLATGPEESHDPFAVLHDLYWVTAALAERGPLLLAIDDAHWADPGSLDYLGFLLPRLEELPVLLAMASRTDEPEAPPGLARILTDPSLRHLTLAPFTAEATVRLVGEGLGQAPDPAFAEACHEVSGGNPFLLSELVRALLEQDVSPTSLQSEKVREQAPQRVARMVLGRIARLPPYTAAVARALAILGDGSDRRLLAAMAGGDAEATQRAADELRESSIFDAGPSLRFIHPLTRNAIYTEIPFGERSVAHARAAALLRERKDEPERIATHLLATEERGDRETVETLFEAGQQALAAGAPRSAIAYLTRALREPAPADLRSQVLDPLLTATLRAADQAAFASIEGDVFDEWERDPSLRSRWAIQLTMVMALSGRFEEAASMLVEAVEVAAAEGDVERAYQLKAQLSTFATMVPTVPEVDIAGLDGQIDPDSPTGRLAAAMEVRAAAASGTARQMADAAKRALGNDASIFAEEPEIAAASIAVMTLVTADEMEAARHGAERALAIARERGSTTELARGLFLEGLIAWGYGDLPSAEADLRQAIDLARLAGIVPLVLMYTGALLEVLIERDELEVAQKELEALGMAEGPAPTGPLLGMLLMMRVHLRVEQGRFEDAVEDFEALASEVEKTGYGPGPIASVSPWAAHALIALGRQEQAREMADEALAWAEYWGAPSGISHVLRAVAETRGGDEAVRLLERAVEVVDGSPRRLEHALALLALGTALRRAGRRAEARAPLREAFELARRCGAARTARRASEELRATGETVRRYTPIGVESLTPSERRVAELAASGMTNRQIAQSLFVTVKTVEAHLSATYHKLDIRSRRELPAALGANEG
ncbi:MAG TPA: AAA family ATPase [Solirubrobacterales bacterium]|nr:AAA family ATPase [Solirubrobacterales bacterium]